MLVYFSGLGGAQDRILQYVTDNFEHHRGLVSYAYPGHYKKLMRFGFESIYLDSGAFSAFKIGTEIVHDEYLAWAEERQDSFEIITALDVIGDYEGSVKNFDYGRKRLDVWPVYHFGEPQWVLDHYMTYTNHICVGGIASGTVTPGAVRRSLDWVFSLYPKMQLHVLGVNCFTALMPYPVWSCDAMTWRSGSRFGDAFIGGTRYKVGKTVRSKDYQEAIQILKGRGVDIEKEDFDWTELDLYNLSEIYRTLEVEHEEFDRESAAKNQYLF